jgi:hypothetical protein
MAVSLRVVRFLASSRHLSKMPPTTRNPQNKRQANESNRRWDDWVPQERLRKLTEENKELAANLKKDMEAQRRAATGKPASMSHKKRPYGSDVTGSSARGSEDRSSAVPQGPRGQKRGREIEGIDKVNIALLTKHDPRFANTRVLLSEKDSRLEYHPVVARYEP